MKFVIPYHITDEDYIAFNDHHLKYTPFGRKVVRNSRIALAVFALLLIGLCWLWANDAVVTISVAVAVTAVSAAYTVFFRRSMLKTLRKNVQRARKTGRELFSPRGELTVDFEAGILVDKTDKMTLEFPFSSVQQYYETDTACYIYVQPRGGIIVPYHIFLKNDEWCAFRECARSAFQR